MGADLAVRLPGRRPDHGSRPATGRHLVDLVDEDDAGSAPPAGWRALAPDPCPPAAPPLRRRWPPVARGRPSAPPLDVSSLGIMPPSRSLNWTPISSTPWGVMIERRSGHRGFSGELELDLAIVELPLSAACLRSFSRVSRSSPERSLLDGSGSPGMAAKSGRQQQHRARAPRRAPRPWPCARPLLLPRQSPLDGELGEVADDRLDVAARHSPPR